MKLSLLVAGLLSVGVAHANLVTGGSFEEPALLPGTTQAYASGSTDIIGWTVVGGTNVQLVEKDFVRTSGYSLDASHGNQWVDLTGTNEGVNKGLSTTFAAMSGQTYTLSFDVGRLLSRGKASVELVINGVSIAYYSNDGVAGGNVMNWFTHSTSFVAQTSNTLVFKGTDQTGGNTTLIGLDNVSVTAVPEPAGFALALVALGVAGVVGKRRRG